MLERFPDGRSAPVAVFLRTVRYVSTVLRNGIYVLVRDGAVRLFVPFTSGHEFRNSWFDQLELPSLGVSATVSPEKWWANAGILCTKPSPDVWGPSFVCAFRHLVECAVTKGQIKDCEFILNKRDHPCVRRDLAHPWTHVWGGSPPKAVEGELLPFLSSYVGPDYADIPFPLTMDWERAIGAVFAGDTHAVPQPIARLSWGDKVPTAFFRGSSTGAGTTPDTNVRMRLCSRSGDVISGVTLDCGITRVSRRYKIARGKVSTDRPVPTSSYVPMEEQARFKYLIVCDGHSAPNRVATLLQTGSLLLWVESSVETPGKRMWFYEAFREREHFLRVAPDLSDLDKVVTWASEHDDECKKITARAVAQASTVFSAEGVLRGAYEALRRTEALTSQKLVKTLVVPFP